MQGVKNNAEEEEQYMTIGEDGRPYIAVRRKTEEEKEKIQEGATHTVFKQREEEDGMEEEEQYMTIGADGRPYIAVRIKRGSKLKENNRSEEVGQREVQRTDTTKIEDADVRIEEGVTVIEEEDEETESLIREYQRNAIPDAYNLKLVEFYGGEEWRKNEGAEIKRCIQ